MKLHKNVGPVDRTVRITLALFLAVLILRGTISGIRAVIAGIAAVALAVTGITGFCSCYVPFGISTR